MWKRPAILTTASLITLLALFAPAQVASADIFQWEYINPANPSQGKQPSTTLCPDGAGANAVPAVDLSNRNLTKAYLIGADLSAIPIYGGGEFGDEITGYDAAHLNGANLSQADLTNANLTYAWLTNANLSGAEVRGARFSRTASYVYGSGLTPAQLYSTASYQAHDLTGIKLEENNLAGVNLVGQDLTNASFFDAELTDANLSHANLTNVVFDAATLTGANLAGAEVREAHFSNITETQFYSTASYQAHDLSGIKLGGDRTGWNFAGQNLTGAGLGATLTAANFSQANLTNAHLNIATLTNANLSQANLTHANFSYASLTGANLAGTEVQGADFYRNTEYGTGVTTAQLYSTASYQAHDLTGIKLGGNNLAGVNLGGQNLTNAHFLYATLSGANLSGADMRGADFYNATLTGANTSNLIQSDGQITGLDLTSGASLTVRDYDGNPSAAPPTGPLPIVVDQQLAVDASGTLRLVFDADAWDSTISFVPGISVARGGTLELAFAPNVNLAAQIGRAIDLFDWSGVMPSGTFNVSSPYTWNLSNLYTTGEVTLTAAPGIVPGDFNSNGIVDAADYVVWRKSDGTAAGYNMWRSHFGQPSGSGAALPSAETLTATVPEPTTLALLILVTASWCIRRGRAA